MIEDFIVRREVLENSGHEVLHFELKLNGKEYQGHYRDEEVNWFQMQPDQEDHEMPLEELDAEVKARVVNWLGE